MRGLSICLILTLCLAWTVVAPAAFAQDVPGSAAPADADGIDYDAWEAEATRAENVMEAAVASTAFLENLRASLVSWRARFLAAQGANDARIATIQSQIDALGSPPEDGLPEPDAIAERRAVLAEALAEAQVPRVNASEAFNRADGLIREIDAVLTERQAERLLELHPAPWNPVNWGLALSSLRDFSRSQSSEIAEALMEEGVESRLRSNMGSVIVSAALGLFLILFGRRYMRRWAERLQAARDRPGLPTLSYLLSLGQIAFPFAGVILIMLALSLTELLPDDLIELIYSALAMMLAAYVGVWLAGRLIPVRPDPHAVILVPDPLRKTARRCALIIGAFMGLSTLAQTIAGFDDVAPGARGVFVLPVYLGLSYGFWLFTKVIMGARAAIPEDQPLGFVLWACTLLARLVFVIALVGPLLAFVGYLNAAEALMLPTAITLVVLAILLSLQSVIRDLYALVFRKTEADAAEALTPVLVNIVLACAVAPILALAWGMRPERLGELYEQFLEGQSIGGVQLTPAAILAVLLVFAAGYLVTRILQSALRTTVLPRTRLDTGARNAVVAGVGYVGIALAAVIAITAAGIDLTALGFVLGALSVGIGFGLQNVVNNFVSGIILLIERPISEGDWIEVNGNMGIVKDISVRSTRIETFDRTDVIVPNGDFISGTVTNWTRGNNVGRAVLTVGVAYGTDTRRVAEILHEIAEENPMVARFPEPGVDFLGFGADSLDFRIRAILRDVNQLLTVKTEINHRIAERFAEEGIEIPFAQRDIWLKNPESLRTAVHPANPGPVGASDGASADNAVATITDTSTEPPR